MPKGGCLIAILAIRLGDKKGAIINRPRALIERPYTRESTFLIVGNGFIRSESRGMHKCIPYKFARKKPSPFGNVIKLVVIANQCAHWCGNLLLKMGIPTPAVAGSE